MGGLFFGWYGGHRDLHSCPKRRASDLGGASIPGMAVKVLSRLGVASLKNCPTQPDISGFQTNQPLSWLHV